MNPNIQPGLHPDADMLNAFAERALPEADRVQVLAHMAECPRCREVVFLARAASEPEIALLATPEPRPAWFSAAFAKWRVALVPAAAIATVGAIVLWVQLHPTARPPQMAKIDAPQATSLPPQTASPSAQGPAREDKLAAPQPPPTAAATPQMAKPAISNQLSPNAVLPSAAIAPTGQLAVQPRPVGAIHLDGRSAATARYAPQPQPPSPSSTYAFSARPPVPDGRQDPALVSGPGIPSAGAPVTASAAPAPPPPNILPVSGQGMPAAEGPSQIVLQSSQTELAPQPMNGFTAMRLAPHPKLPSGLAAISSAALLNRLVAIDSAGGVFLSQDGGKHWGPVTAQWTGKAVQVQAPPQALHGLMTASAPQPVEFTSVTADAAASRASSDNAAPVPPPSPAPSPASASISLGAKTSSRMKTVPPVLPLHFKLITDRHQVWVSADGKLWREQ